MLNNLFLNLNSWWRVLYIHQRVRGVHTLWAVHAMVRWPNLSFHSVIKSAAMSSSSWCVA